ncbi:ABC transporter G family member 23 [Orchesella cincta]|uniref:ABC transporter G family member 23 n=1 Tax=Orchesella cincta TaxID=48709 RepID=A0A1D2M4F1_ORCCI|nr:ABC transporter G family member 23 [Orchesella cincta]
MFVTPAVSVINGYKSYFKGKPVLDNFNMTVPKGTIYGLLGASGCGKTTMLSCLVGLRQLDSGDIRVFGAKPGTISSGIPGKKLGYMPQDIALYPHFSIKEIMQYFGRIYGMSQLEILGRIEFLTNFLNLPDGSRIIAGLSGGQQRRVSLSITLIHDPELLILDEPTVGCDPVLRENIWDHLIQLVERGRTTVIMKPVNLIRKDQGLLLAGDTVDDPRKVDPVTATLSEISFYSKRKIFPFKPKESEYNMHLQSEIVGINYKRKYSMKPTDMNNMKRRQSIIEIVNDEAKAQRNRIRALIVRNVINFLRNPVFLFGMVLLPAFQVTLTALTIGYDVKDMSIGVINNEFPNWLEECGTEERGCSSGNLEGLSCRYLNSLPKDTLNLIPYTTKEEAVDDVHRGNLWGILTIPANYSKHIIDRSTAGNFAENDTLEGTILRTHLDMSHYMAAVLMVRKFYLSFETYIKELGVDCGGMAKEFEIPLHYREPVYGSQESKYKEYIIPGALTMLLFLIPMCSCGLAYISDKKQGTMERSRSAGVTTFDFMMAFFFTEGLVIIIQAILSTTILTLGFDFTINGSIVWYTLLCLLAGLCGQSWGFILGLICSDETSVLLTASSFIAYAHSYRYHMATGSSSIVHALL